MKVLLLDNYDSFTGTIVHALEALGATCQVRRSDSIDVEQVTALRVDRIVLSPGPYGPQETGICPEAVRSFARSIPVLGICLGMQVIANVAGARVCSSGRPVHGKASEVLHSGTGIFDGLPNPFAAARYHSLEVVPSSVTEQLEVTARTREGVIMGCRLKDTRVDGVLFHPESFLTEAGPRIFENFLRD